ncbi:MAG: LuxR C-terminal-related transcriptional regulator [Burkholderiaceae bacterium]|jgi:DNA-binding NarL/FixJ family response regulator
MASSKGALSPTLLLVDDHPLIRRALAESISSALPDARLWSSASAEEAVIVARTQLQQGFKVIALMDLGLPGLSGLGAIQALKSLQGEILIITVSGSDDEAQVSAALGAGAHAFVSKGAPIEGLIQVVSEALAGNLPNGTWLSAQGYRDSGALRPITLTERQLQVLSMICEGHNNRDIAATLGISEITAKSHISGLFRALGVVSRTQAILAAQRLGLSAPR